MTKHARTESATGADAIVEHASLPTDPMIYAYAWWLDQAGEWSNEALQFVNRRLHKDLETAAQLMTCEDSSKALALQARFANDLAADYLDEGKKMFELMARAATPQRGSNQRGARRSQ